MLNFLIDQQDLRGGLLLKHSRLSSNRYSMCVYNRREISIGVWRLGRLAAGGGVRRGAEKQW